ncbi:uncharacterized protein LOC106012974 [Aplysia californica]|uniref:Uncharacterized protein LOC106012974 n=1 Tax=Aplysia californica TaxID=6500 RepID=A0ABM1A8L2_APLCA|nr:uncharacterized protein LOC106012974 [Aplysia californica]
MDFRDTYFAAVVVVVAVFFFHTSEQQGQQSNKCLEDFSNTLLGCVREAGMTEGSFLWFVTNGTSKRSSPPSNEATFKEQICGAQQQVGACVFQRVAPVVNSSACVGTSQATNQQDIIRTQLTTIFSTYDGKCMHLDEEWG